MSKNINDIYNLSKSDNEIEFINSIFNLSKEEIEFLNYKLLDKNIIENKDFSLKTKLSYEKYFNRDILNEIIEKLVIKPFEKDYDDLMYLAKLKPTLRKQLLDILCIRSNNDLECNKFVEDLESSNLYKKYIDSIINSNDIFLKIHIALYFGYLDELFKNNIYLAHLIVETDECSIFMNSKSDHLLRLSRLSNDKETLCYIKKHLIPIMTEEYNKLYEHSNMDEEKKQDNLNLRITHVVKMFNKNTRGLIN